MLAPLVRALEFRFGTGTLTAPVPAWIGSTVVRTRPGLGLEAGLGPAQIAERLRATPLPGIARHARRVAVLVPDATRVARTDHVLAALDTVLGEVGLGRDRIQVILATGTHPPQVSGESPWLARAARHDARSGSAVVELGVTSSGNRVLLARHVVDAEFVVLTGRISNHYFAGFSGGAKALLPGVAAYETVLRNHRRALDEQCRPDPRAVNGRLAGNPVREEMESALELLRPPAFIVNTIVDDGGEIRDLCAGDRTAFEAACARADASCRIEVDATFDVVVAGCGGRPGDASFMQALKAPCNVWPAARPGGALIWVADCGTSRLEGFERWLSLQDLAELRAAVARNYDLFGHNCVFLRSIGSERMLVLVSRLPPERVRRLGLHPASSLAEAFDVVRARLGGADRCLVIEDANNCYVPGSARA